MPTKNLTGKVALVTGASKGIGQAVAKRLAQDGAAAVVNYWASSDGAEATVADIEKAGGRAIAVKADVSQVREIERLFDATLSRFGKLDILVNNAGFAFHKPIVETTEQDFDGIFAVNVKGTYFACQQAAKHMTDGGRIINLSSSTTGMLLPDFSAYIATKGAVEQITRSLAREFGARRITVNAVSPGPTDTDLFSRGMSDQEKQRIGQMAALGRLGLPQDIADVVALLASDDAHWITGQNIRANGGII